MKRIFLAVLALSIFLAATTISSPAVLLAAHSGGARGHVQSTNGSLTLIPLTSTDGLPHWGQQVTFNVSTTATTEPNVSLNCYQNGVLVYGAVAGFYPSYPWPWTQIFTLSSPSWTSGGANCTATLYYFSGKKTITLATMSVQVYS